eukprot:2011379-Amphidinium_carterae.1
MGILDEIPAAGIFPQAEGPSSAVLQSQAFAAKLLDGEFCSESFLNYRSFDEAGDLAMAEVTWLESR